MRTTRIYQPGQFAVGETITLSPEASHHVAVVLRMRVGERICLFCGDNRAYEAEIQDNHKKRVTLRLLSLELLNRESPLRLHLVQAVSKGQRMETVVQKAVELGVASITPVISAHCAVKLNDELMSKKCQQWQAVAISACEQSGRNTLPLIHPMINLSDYLKQKPAFPHFVLDPEASTNWRAYGGEGKMEMGLLIGPEGGLSEDEMRLLLAQNFLPLRLGPRVLRTETAAIVALSVLQAVFCDL